MPEKLLRRDVLVFAGAGIAAYGLPACALLRGGAKHPVYEPSAASIEGESIRIPLEELKGLSPADALQITPPKPYVELLVNPVGDGSFRVITAHCTHRGCIVDWDKATTEWACPCHGSRYSADGKVVEGPAKDPLVAPRSRVEDGKLVIEVGGLTPRKA